MRGPDISLSESKLSGYKYLAAGQDSIETRIAAGRSKMGACLDPVVGRLRRGKLNFRRRSTDASLIKGLTGVPWNSSLIRPVAGQ